MHCFHQCTAHKMQGEDNKQLAETAPRKCVRNSWRETEEGAQHRCSQG